MKLIIPIVGSVLYCIVLLDIIRLLYSIHIMMEKSELTLSYATCVVEIIAALVLNVFLQEDKKQVSMLHLQH